MHVYDAQLDRLITHNSVNSNFGRGFHNFIIDEIELGARVAIALDEEDQWFWVLYADEVGSVLSTETYYTHGNPFLQ